MKLFHYHHWTPAVEETERFYRERGFRVTLRNGKVNGSFSRFDPPLEWADFCDQPILFRIIELVRGQVNVTFGYGKENRFDHLGFLVSVEACAAICQRAESWGWEIERGERRTFVYTPYRFKIELQTRQDVVEPSEGESAAISRLVLGHKEAEVPQRLRSLLDDELAQLSFVQCEQTGVVEVVLEHADMAGGSDPCGVMLSGI